MTQFKCKKLLNWCSAKSISDRLIGKFLAADIHAIGILMYNLRFWLSTQRTP
ncbi:hypothetical protein [Myxacorys almedinensis]|uniref:Uncharacterized protein n=1 Tax=Myxacorys almedinensis A TaxID=2690445 RepID=A0A8J7Z7T9_9CYAN|nr:hypothetical protein [Myxacorys almedinensis]NDJ17968.1 hypothetical protein [Myxacorys almedinensis A]